MTGFDLPFGRDFDDEGNVISLPAPEPADDRWQGWDAEPDKNSDPTSSWSPLDLTSVLDGSWTRPQPTVGRRDDGVGLLYLGRQHTLVSESEGGKTWLMLAIATTEINAGNAVVYIDFEDDEGGIAGRLLTLGLPPEKIRRKFAYIRPDRGIDAAGRSQLEQAVGDLRPTFAVLDGVTEGMVLHGLDPLSNADVAAFGHRLPGWLASRGPAVMSSDHVPKSTENRGRYAIGAAHKLNGLNGAQYLLTNRKPFGIGITGRSTLLLAKDRPGQLRRHALPSGEGLHWFADLVLESRDETFAEVSLAPPNHREDVPFRPTVLMQRVSDALTKAAGPLTVRGVLDRAKGKRDSDVRVALAALVDEGFVVVEKGDRGAHLHRLVHPFGVDS